MGYAVFVKRFSERNVMALGIFSAATPSQTVQCFLDCYQMSYS